MKLLELCEQVEADLDASGVFFGHGTDNAFDEAVWLVCSAADIDLATDEDLPWEQEIEKSAMDSVDALLKKRIETGKPLAYLLNEAWFAGEKFYIDERAIIPRSHLGEWIPDKFEPWLLNPEPARILDLCTGSGCIAIALALTFDSAAVDAADLSEDALAVARENRRRFGLESRLNLLHGDLFAPVAGNRYDLIVCNPPYVSEALMQDLPGEYEFEPGLAFLGGESGLDLVNQILLKARGFLNPGGVLVMEVGSANHALEKFHADVPFTWLSSENEDAAVFLISAEELEQYFSG